MARFYAHENFPFPVVKALRELNHDVLTVPETGRARQAVPDEEILEFARKEQRILLTLNRKHFIQLHSTRPDHTGILVCTFDPDFAAQARRIHQAVAAQPQLAGQLIRVIRSPTGIRRADV